MQRDTNSMLWRRGKMAALGAGLLALAAGFGLLAAHLLAGVGGGGMNELYDHWLYDGLMVGAAALCLARAAAVPGERLSWALVGLGLLAWAWGEIYWTFWLADAKGPTFPSLADAGYLGFYPLMAAGLVLIVRRRLRRIGIGLWLDALALAFAVASLGAAVVLKTVGENLGNKPAVIAEALSYPIADILLLAFLAALLVLTNWRPGWSFGLLLAGLATTGIADAIYSDQLAVGAYEEGGWLDLLWPASALMIAVAAWAPARATAAARRPEGWRALLVPLGVGSASIALFGLQTWDSDPITSALLGATAVVVLARLAVAYIENESLLRQVRNDGLTGLGNRAQLELDLRRETAARDGSSVLAVFDLNGFKNYNDTFGHPAGDALLARLAGQLAGAVEGAGHAYRLGGDEFCVLLAGDASSRAERIEAAAAALSETGESFGIGAAFGSVEVPVEAKTPEAAIQLADRRMYANKANGRITAGQQVEAVLMRALRERQPELGDHLDSVSELAVAVGRRLGLEGGELAVLARAAELHDVGKVAIPDAILDKPGRLTDAEQEFVRRHTMIGERILASAPDLMAVARIVRSSHERYDGEGYPDRLAGEEIPLASRIVFVCDAFHAMTSARPYSPPVSPREALAELRRCAGTQFDPKIVMAFGEALIEGIPGLTDVRERAAAQQPAHQPAPSFGARSRPATI